MKKIFLLTLLVACNLFGQRGIVEKDTAVAKTYVPYLHVVGGTDGTYWRILKLDGNGNIQTEPAKYDSVGYADSTVSTIWKAIPLDFEATLVEVFAITPVDIKVSPDTTADSLYVKGGWVQTLLVPVDTLYAKSTTGTPHVVVNHYK